MYNYKAISFRFQFFLLINHKIDVLHIYFNASMLKSINSDIITALTKLYIVE